MSSMSDSWNRIHRWLVANAPKIMHGLNPPATPQEIKSIELSLRLQMPDEWRELYQAHNGLSDKPNLGSLFYGMQFLTLEQMLLRGVNTPSDGMPLGTANDPFGMDSVSVRAADAGIRKDDFHNPKWISFAEDWGDCQLRVDLDPASDGILGQVIFTDQADGTVILVASSIAQLVSDFASDLEAGKYFLDKDSLKDGQEFLSCVPENDIINWSFSPRWQHLSE